MSPYNAEFPIVQVALDFIDLDRALRIAREAVRGGTVWLEAGTPLIKSEGLNVIRTLRAEFPHHTIVADLKIMDAGRVEVEMAAKAGADIAVALGQSTDATIMQCIEAGRNYGCRIAVDTIGCPDPARRAREAQAMGADLVGVHLPVDEQMQGLAATERLKAVAAAVTIPIMVAGGVNSETAAAMVAAGASVVIVGGAIHKAANATEATQAICTAIRTRTSIGTEFFRRGGEADLVTILSRVSSSNLSDALHRGGALEGLRQMVPGASAAGPAATVRTAPGDWAKPVEAIDHARPGEILVIDAGGTAPAIWGGCATLSAQKRGLAGVVIDGYVRDYDELLELGFPVFARGVVPNAGEPKGFGETGTPVRVGGMKIFPGDWIKADASGVVAVEKAKAVEYANRAMDVYEQECRIKAEIEAGNTLAGVVNLLRWEKR